jgi:hypothetical protein
MVIKSVTKKTPFAVLSTPLFTVIVNTTAFIKSEKLTAAVSKDLFCHSTCRK